MVQSILQPGSYLGLFGFMVLTGCGLPLPEEVAIICAGVLSAEGKLNPQIAFGAVLAGALVGDAVMYHIGRRFGHNLAWIHPKLAKIVQADREEYFEKAILQHGFKVLFLARFMVGVRGPVYLAAGVVRMPFRRFLLWDLVSATAVVGLFFGLSFYFGQDIARLLREAEVTLTLAVLAIALVAVLVIMRRQRRRLAEKVIEDAAVEAKVREAS
jgi:membrane protein DedA with SNARE-associated domain